MISRCVSVRQLLTYRNNRGIALAQLRLFAQKNETPKPASDASDKTRLKHLSKTPIGKLEEFGTHPYAEKEPLKKHEDGVNPSTGEVGGPAGPEPTRYGDWERKGRVTDF